MPFPNFSISPINTAPITYSNGTDGEGPILVFEEAQYVDGESNITAAYNGDSDLPINGGIVTSPDATSTEEGQAKLDQHFLNQLRSQTLAHVYSPSTTVTGSKRYFGRM